ncbi:hypothetical protein C499_15725 [Halogeometricum borinquense DSM 11551]|uniref:Predicted membrane protein (DUF2078) n=2 Tax=Halogeometricum borinquense TaxID=60847 RepID=E4NSK2_HALBP|nr:SHOCT domain-containing protein [Halogeometricum borinquense]ADQ68095.1 Predicted membrane protein (DUF2078) [Halogeometricum borinquense DSM 11551]ELY24861.1 hypothetical protein C499_15725 [Halogeometricum borinquense DSM 11551]RYJ12994.1 SHOCT domain-containing protein [Halogeometricum borinquense]
MDDDVDDGDGETALQKAVGGVVIALVLLIAFTLLALDVSFFWVAFPVGFGGVLPAAIGITKWYEQRQKQNTHADKPSETEEALETLRRRYATGEIDEAEFERRVERLLGTETVEDAESYVSTPTEQERELER